jgi:hypothetical protein
MSLNFVSSAVLSSTDGISHNEEKPIESAEAEEVRRNGASGSSKPLFEQLQFNRDKEQEDYDAVTKSMRGTRTLDDEDCAHLESIEAAKMARERHVKKIIEDEVVEFRAARADRSVQSRATTIFEDEGGKESNVQQTVAMASQNDARARAVTHKASIVIVGKKRRRQPVADIPSGNGKTTFSSEKRPGHDQKDGKKASSSVEMKEPVALNDSKKIDVKGAATASSGLGGLLGCYSSEDDSD